EGIASGGIVRTRPGRKVGVEIAAQLNPELRLVIARVRKEIEPVTTRGPTVEMFGNAHAEQTRIGQEDVGGETAVVAVQEVAGYRGGVEHVLHIAHNLPTGLIGQDEREVQVGIAMDTIIGIVVED